MESRLATAHPTAKLGQPLQPQGSSLLTRGYVCSIREGNYAVLTQGHILLLNWNRQTAPLLRQLALAQKEQFTSKPR